MATIELTKEEKEFIYNNLGNLQVQIGTPNAGKIATMGETILIKLKAQIEQPETESPEKKENDS